MSTKVAVCQVPDIREDVETSLQWIERFVVEAEQAQVDLICFPECFLQGYLTEIIPARKNALHLQSTRFNKILLQLSKYSPIIVFGMIEEEEELIFNTAVVIKGGVLIGKYRKTHLLEGEKLFTAGIDYPVFKVNDLTFGINICYDTQFPDATAALTDQGAKLVLCVSNTMMSTKKAIKYKNLHLSMRRERVMEKKMWMLSADITGEREGRIAYGSTSVINPEGEIVRQVPFLETGMIIIDL